MPEHGDVWRSPCGAVELRCGRWQDVLADVEGVDAVITDTPYSERTHAGALDATTLDKGVTGYAHWTGDDARAFIACWSPRCTGWLCVHNDDVLGPEIITAMSGAGRYAFRALPVLQQQPRVTGDGPAQHGHYLHVARPRKRRFLSWGSLPGWYKAKRDGSIVRGGKPLALMRAIVRDYSRPGDLVCDPCAGGATTLLAAAMEGRRAIGAEMDPPTFDLAVKRLSEGWTVDMFADSAAAKPEQMALGGGVDDA